MDPEGKGGLIWFTDLSFFEILPRESWKSKGWGFNRFTASSSKTLQKDENGKKTENENEDAYEYAQATKKDKNNNRAPHRKSR